MNVEANTLAGGGTTEYTKLDTTVEVTVETPEAPKPPEANEYTKLTEEAAAAVPDVPNIEVPEFDELADKLPMDLLSLGGHNGRLVTFTQPTYCALCGKFIWGVFKQGFRCKDCSLATHRHCYPLTYGKCTCKGEEPNEEENLNQPEAPQEDNARAHDFEPYSFKTPTFCDHCGSLLYGCCSQGVKCIACKKNVHHRCRDRATHLCGIDAKLALKKVKEMQEKVPGFGKLKAGDGDEEGKRDDDGDKQENGAKPEDDDKVEENGAKPEEKGDDDTKEDDKEEDGKKEDDKKEDDKKEDDKKEEDKKEEKDGAKE